MTSIRFAISASALMLLHEVPSEAQGQVPLTGQVVAMPGGRPIAMAEVHIKSLSRMVRTDSNGVFLMDSVPKGQHLVEAVKPGFRTYSSMLSVMSMSDPEYRIELTTAPAMVAGVTTTADRVTARMTGFEERRLKRGGGGRFLNAKDFEQHIGRPTADILARVPGIDIIRGPSGAAFLGNNRGPETLRDNMLPRVSKADQARGAKVGACYAAVMVNGVTMYDGVSQELFDINSIPASDIAGMEYYGGGASIPVQWSGLTPSCGLIVIWTKN